MTPRNKRETGRLVVAVGLLVLVAGIALARLPLVNDTATPAVIVAGFAMVLGGVLLWTSK